VNYKTKLSLVLSPVLLVGVTLTWGGIRFRQVLDGEMSVILFFTGIFIISVALSILDMNVNHMSKEHE
jgi:hypothetical protein